MSKTIIFNEPFESKLKELRIKTRFVKNIKDDCKQHNDDCKQYNYELREYLNYLNQRDTWYSFINCAFTWCTTPEYKTNNHYWANIALK